jgi:putative transcriptional regulator
MDYLDNPTRRSETLRADRTSANSYGFWAAFTEGQTMAKSVRTTVTPEIHQDIIRSVDWDRVSRMTGEAIAEDIARDSDAMPFADADGMALRIQMIRKGLSLSQAQFAAQFHIPLATLKDWEQGRRQPEAAAWAYLQVIEGEPAAVRRALKAA